MHPDVYRNLIVIAAKDPTGERMDRLANQLADAERAMEILRAKGYGHSGLTASQTAARVPNAADL